MIQRRGDEVLRLQPKLMSFKQRDKNCYADETFEKCPRRLPVVCFRDDIIFSRERELLIDDVARVKIITKSVTLPTDRK